MNRSEIISIFNKTKKNEKLQTKSYIEAVRQYTYRYYVA